LLKEWIPQFEVLFSENRQIGDFFLGDKVSLNFKIKIVNFFNNNRHMVQIALNDMDLLLQ
jgi:hypothetical protein